MSALPSESFDLGHSHTGNTDFRERRSHVVELEGFNDCSDQFHSRTPGGARLGNTSTIPLGGTRTFMPRITFIEPDGFRREIDAPLGITLMEAAVSQGVQGILALCGG